MKYNESLPNKRLKSDNDKTNNYLTGVVERTEKKISALQSIVNRVINDLEYASKQKIIDNQNLKNTFDTILNYCEFSSYDLEAYFDFMCDVIHEMREIANFVDDGNTIRDYIIDCEKTINALLTIVTSSQTLIEEEVTQSDRFLKDGTSCQANC